MATRKLAAILFADIVGYTALMQQDEKQALARLQRFKEALEAQVPAYRGKIIQYYGDGCLAIFDSSVDAVSCAKLLQEGFTGELDVPVRLGLHTGEVMLKEGNVYGNAVNITSRVESIGVPGSVLLSSSVRNQIRNQADFELKNLGRFAFKNVEGGMSVYALANKGLTIPQSGEIEGKLKKAAPTKSQRIWIFPMMITLAVLLGIFVIWKNNSPTSPLTEAERQKRVAVMVFENKSGNEALEDFGTMISDWITKGLMETGEANVISAANVQSQIQQAGVGNVGSPALAEATSIGLTIQGRYYFEQEQLLIQTNIVDAVKGKVIYALDPIQGPRQDLLNLLKELTNEVLSYWAIKEQPRFLQDPPKYEAYQKYIEGSRFFSANFEKAENYLKNSFALDSGFYAPLLKLTTLYHIHEKEFLRDSIISLFAEKDPELTEWESLRLEIIHVMRKRDYQKGALLNERLYQLDSSDLAACYNAGRLYTWLNQPMKALRVLTSFDTSMLKSRKLEIGWIENYIALVYFYLREYNKAIQIVKGYSFSKLYVENAKLHLASLIRSRQMDLIDSQLASYEKAGIYNYKGQEEKIDLLYITICDELLLARDDTLLTFYTNKFEQWSRENDNTSAYNEAMIAYYRENFDQVVSILEKAIVEKHFVHSKEELFAILGICHARNHSIERAREYVKKIDSLKSQNPKWNYYGMGAITAWMNDKEEALRLFKNYIKFGGTFYYPLLKDDKFLLPLFSYPPFEELVKPKG